MLNTCINKVGQLTKISIIVAIARGMGDVCQINSPQIPHLLLLSCMCFVVRSLIP